jgi:hypothetical protein
MVVFTSVFASAAGKDSVTLYALPDSVKAGAFISEVRVTAVTGKKEVRAGIQTSTVGLYLEAEKNEREVVFSFPSSARVIATGIGVEAERDEIEWEYQWKTGTDYKLLIASAADSAGNFVIYSGYIWLPENNKWKLVGSCRIDGQWASLNAAATMYSVNKKAVISAAFTNAWVQRNNGSWKRMDNGIQPAPVVNLFSHVDSLQQLEQDTKHIRAAMANGLSDVTNDTAGVFYKIINPGTGKTFTVNDTVTVYYKLRIFGGTEIIDQASDKPATFPLNRLIRAWQLAVPLVRTGGKLKLVIPSGLAYSIRTRAPKIPPNSILEFEIEVVDAKAAAR